MPMENNKNAAIQTSFVTGFKRKSSEYTPLCRTITKKLTKKMKSENGITSLLPPLSTIS